MQFPDIDESTRKAVNALTLEEVKGENSHPYNHEILWYGVDAVVHFHLMTVAQDISGGKISQEEFFERYELRFNDSLHLLIVPLEKIESDGIFIPKHAYWDKKGNIRKRRRKIFLFNVDYNNFIRGEGWVDKEYARQLTYRSWHPSDLKDPVLIEQGVKFGRDLWITCVDVFEKTKDGDGCLMGVDADGKEYYSPPQPEKITDLGEKLIAYYSAIVLGE